MGGKTSSKSKNRYNLKAYDRMTVFVKKGEKEKIKLYAQEHGESLNGFIKRALYNEMERTP